MKCAEARAQVAYQSERNQFDPGLGVWLGARGVRDLSGIWFRDPSQRSALELCMVDRADCEPLKSVISGVAVAKNSVCWANWSTKRT